MYSVAGNFSGAVTISSTLTLGAGITGVSRITGEGFAIGTNNLRIYDSTSKANRITANWSDGVARIYAINEAGTTYSDLCIGQTQGNSASLYFNASTANWGIGTTAPAYKLHVIGSGYFSSTLKTASELNANTVRISATSTTAHLAFGRGNYNYITAPSGGGIAFVTNGKEVSGDNTDMYVGDGRVSVGGSLSSEKLYVPSSLGNEVFDIYVDTEVNIDGETPVSVSFQPQWYGWINADGTAAKQGGSATLTAVRTAAGTLRLNGIAADSTVIAVPAAFSTGSTGSPRTTASVLKSGSAHYVQTYNNAGTRANLAFYLLVI